jgi:SAM-dependent methyltransferase
MTRQTEANRRLWDELTAVHLKGSRFYPINAFRKGRCVLNDIEMEEVGDVTGKTLLHLQCHFGMDTLSWARMGARVTGADFSEVAIISARRLSGELRIPSTFVVSDVLSLPAKLKKKFDIVFASYGALYWISRVDKWFEVAASFLKKNGFVYVVDGHPFRNWLTRDETVTDLSKFPYSYFDRSAQRYGSSPDYADKSHVQTKPEYGWHHTIEDLIGGAVGAGLRIEWFHEFPSFKIRKYRDAWRPIGDKNTFPVMFSMKATKT